MTFFQSLWKRAGVAYRAQVGKELASRGAHTLNIDAGGAAKRPSIDPGPRFDATGTAIQLQLN